MKLLHTPKDAATPIEPRYLEVGQTYQRTTQIQNTTYPHKYVLIVRSPETDERLSICLASNSARAVKQLSVGSRWVPVDVAVEVSNA